MFFPAAALTVRCDKFSSRTVRERQGYMLRFLRSWLVPILALMMATGIALSFVPLTERAEARAQQELSHLMDRAMEHVSAGARLIAPVIAAQKESLLSKAKAVARFLTHDDALLESDALKALCEQLTIDRIDVADADGVLIASSEEARVALPLGAQDAFIWTMDAADNPEAALSRADEANPGVLYACIGRSDIDGFVLLTRDDPYVSGALLESSSKASIMDLTYGSDIVFQTDIEGEDGFFRDSGSLCLRRTDEGITLIAARPLNDVFAARNAALIALGAALISIIICGVAAYLQRLEPVVALEEEEASLKEGAAPSGLPPESSEPQEEAPKPRARKRADNRTEPRERLEPQDQAAEKPPRTPDGSKGKRKRKPPRPENGEEPFEKIVE